MWFRGPFSFEQCANGGDRLLASDGYKALLWPEERNESPRLLFHNTQVAVCVDETKASFARVLMPDILWEIVQERAGKRIPRLGCR